MNVAVLFNSDDPKYEGWYGEPIRNTVFGSEVIQAARRHVKVRVGDVLVYTSVRSLSEYDTLTKRVYFAGTWSLFLGQRLRSTFRNTTVYALTFENMTRELAVQLHTALSNDNTYLGLECAPGGGQVGRFELTPLAGLPEDGSHDKAPLTQRRVQAAGC